MMLVSLLAAAALSQLAQGSPSVSGSYQKRSGNAIVPPSSTSYEYIVVGSGAGGGPLAARLAMAGKSTLLIEAGDDQGDNIHEQVPTYHAMSTEDPKMSWDYYIQHYPQDKMRKDTKMAWTPPQGGEPVVSPNSPGPGSKQRGMLYPRSGTLGGCTAHNAMVTIYPHEADWNYIANITKDSTWNHRNMRRIFQKMERLDYNVSKDGHGTDGWFNVGRLNVEDGGDESQLVAMSMGMANAKNPGDGEKLDELMAQFEHDINGNSPGRETAEGLFTIPLSIDNMVRTGSRTIIMNVYNAKNSDGTKKYPLDIALDTLATKVLFSKSSSSKPKATGVEVRNGKYLFRASRSAKPGVNGVPGKYTATEEVIISAGTYNTPHLLKLSGIGPKAELEKFKIPQLVDLPGVGTNLQDHFEIGVTYKLPHNITILKDCTFNPSNDPCLKYWEQKSKKGGYGLSNGFPFAYIKKTTVAARDKIFGHLPDLFLFGGMAKFRGYYPGYSKDVYQHNSWTWVVLKAHTENTAGTVTLASADPLDPPNVLNNYFDAGTPKAAANDAQAMAEGLELARHITEYAATGPMSKDMMDGPIVEEVPGPAVRTRAQLIENVKTEAWAHHASCTCPIGADADPMAVLDSKFRVRGTEGLRVVDASVFPRIPGFFVAVPIYMVGEKAAESILEGK